MDMKMKRILPILILAALPASAQEPPATETPPAETAPSTSIDDLRKEYEKIREAVFSSRARAAAVGDSLYSTRLDVKLRYDTPRAWSLRRATVRLDGANIFEDEAGKIAADEAPRFSGFIAPGRHVITIRLEAQAKDDGKFTYASEETFTIDAPNGRSLLIDAVAREDGDIAYNFPRKNRGTYKLRLDVEVTAVEAKARAKRGGEG
jgi:hypothetical protein